ncbi:MAG: DUF2589 domain-containing protein [Pseudomonadota bacterium]
MANVTQQLGAIPFGNLIGGPMTAAVEAQAKAAGTSYDFIRSVGFDDEGNLIKVPLKFNRRTTDADGNAVSNEVSIEVPLLTLLPIPFLRIDHMTIDFTANMSDTSSSEDTKSEARNASVGVEAGAKYLFFSAKLNASYSSKKESTSTKNSRYSIEYNMNVNVHAVQDDMPAGMAKVLNLLLENIPDPGSD